MKVDMDGWNQYAGRKRKAMTKQERQARIEDLATAVLDWEEEQEKERVNECRDN